MLIPPFLQGRTAVTDKAYGYAGHCIQSAGSNSMQSHGVKLLLHLAWPESDRRRGREGGGAIADRPSTPVQADAGPLSLPPDDRSTSHVVAQTCMQTVRGRPGLLRWGTWEGFLRRFITTPSFENLLPVWHRQLFPLIRWDFETFWTFLGIIASTSCSRILLSVQHPRPKMEFQQFCLTSASDYNPPVLLESIFMRFRYFQVQNGG